MQNYPGSELAAGIANKSHRKQQERRPSGKKLKGELLGGIWKCKIQSANLARHWRYNSSMGILPMTHGRDAHATSTYAGPLCRILLFVDS